MTTDRPIHPAEAGPPGGCAGSPGAAVAVLVLRRRAPTRRRPFRAPLVPPTAPLSTAARASLFLSLDAKSRLRFARAAAGTSAWIGYSRRRSHVGRGLLAVRESHAATVEPPEPGATA